jgi:hypothetical protein
LGSHYLTDHYLTDHSQKNGTLAYVFQISVGEIDEDDESEWGLTVGVTLTSPKVSLTIIKLCLFLGY